MTKPKIMTHEQTSAAARKGEGVRVAVISLHSNHLREIESRYLTEPHLTVEDLRKALAHAQASVRSVATPSGESGWVAVVPVDDVRRLIMNVVVVPHSFKQRSLPDQAIEAEQQLQQQRVVAASKVAFEIRRAIEEGAHHENVQEILARAPDPASAERYLKSFRPGAPALLLDSGALPDTSGARLPKTLPSSATHTLEVLVNSVNRAEGNASLTVQRVVSASDFFRDGKTYSVKCPSESFMRALLAAQLIDKEITVRVRGSLPIVADWGQPDVQLQHVEDGPQWVKRVIAELGQLQLPLD